MTDDMNDELGDLTALEQIYSGKLASIRRQKDQLKRRKIEAGEEDRMVTDHALLRYLQRHKDINIDALRDELRVLANEAVPAKDGEHYWHESGVILIIGDAGQVITVLSPEQAEKHAGRKLRNGERVPAYSLDGGE